MISQHIVAGATVVGLLGAPLWWATDRTPPVEMFDMRAVSQSGPPGGQVIIERRQDRKRVCHTEVQRSLFDGANIETKYELDVREAFGATGHETRSVRLMVPKDAFPGTGRARISVTYRCNPLHRLWPIVVVYPDVPFTIEDVPNAR